MSDDIEALKIHKLEPEKPRRHLSVLGHVEEPKPTEHGETEYTREGATNAGPIDVDVVRARIVASLETVFDPEIPVNIYELGLIYRVEITDRADGLADVNVQMTLTSPACPVAQEMPGWVQSALLPIDGIENVDVAIIWEPTWDPSKMAETAKLQLNMFT